MRFIIGTAGLLCLAALQISATTWNEPWHDEVVRLADLFVRVRIDSMTESRAVGKVVKLLGGEEPGGSIVIEGFSKLRIGSMTAGHNDELHLPFKVGADYYLLVKRDPASNTYQLPTPTSGWAFVENDNVYATYRHSYHRGLVPVAPYELTMQGIFNSAKGRKVDAGVSEFIKEQLAIAPARLRDPETPETKRFFLQHAALETVFHTGLNADLQSLEPFIGLPEYQVQISAVRAAGRIGTAQSQERLMRFIEGSGVGFAKVLCVWALRDQNARHLAARLEAFEKKGKDEETGFGGSIMDPRVGTFFPHSVKAAIKEVLLQWKAPAEIRVKPAALTFHQTEAYYLGLS